MHGLSQSEVNSALRACTYFRVPNASPDILHWFLVERLRQADPALADKIGRLDENQRRDLFLDLRHRENASAMG